MMVGVLKEDINSRAKGLQSYGKKGEKVTVIDIRDNVALVRGKDSFPVHISRITIKNTEYESKDQNSTSGTDTITHAVR